MMPDSFFALVLRRIAWRHAVPWLIRGLAAGAVVAALVLLIARVVPLENRAWWALGVGVALAMAGAGVAWLRRPAPATALRRADHLLDLHDRLTTAGEYAGREAPMLRRQRAGLA